MKRKRRIRADKRRFSRSADRTRKINVKPRFMRGGVRL